MLAALDQQEKLTFNQYKLIVAAIFGFTLEFLDYFLIAFILTFVITPWHLSFGASAVILLSSGLGAIAGAAYFGHLADRVGRRKVFLITVSIFSVATGALCFTPDSPDLGWLYLVSFRLLIGFGAGGFVCVDLPLVQEFMPIRRRGMVSGLITASTPAAFFLGSLLVAFVAPHVGWRGLMAICFALSFVTLILRGWIPESPRWLLANNRPAEARRSLAWALQADPETLPLETPIGAGAKPKFSDLFRYPRSLAVSWLTNLGAQTGYYGLTLWTPTLLVQLLHLSPTEAAFRMAVLTLSALVGRFVLSFLSEAIGRRSTGVLCSLAAAAALSAAAYSGDVSIGAMSLFLVLLMVAYFFGEGGFAIVAPYSAEIWPASLRASGMGSAYGFGGIGKIIGPLGLALVIGSSNLVLPKASAEAVTPAFLYFAAWYALAGVVYLALGIETKGRSIESIDQSLRQSERPSAKTSSAAAFSSQPPTI
jgi:putative MFS transporter